MTEVQFHFNAADRLGYACRLLRKATRLGAGVDVTAETQVLADLDRLLWLFDPQEFVPHARVHRHQPLSAAQRRAPVWLCDGVLVNVADEPAHQVLLNLGREAVQGFEAYPRLIEVVTTDPDDRDAGRRRWKHYAGLGYTITRHEVAG